MSEDQGIVVETEAKCSRVFHASCGESVWQSIVPIGCDAGSGQSRAEGVPVVFDMPSHERAGSGGDYGNRRGIFGCSRCIEEHQIRQMPQPAGDLDRGKVERDRSRCIGSDRIWHGLQFAKRACFSNENCASMVISKSSDEIPL